MPPVKRKQKYLDWLYSLFKPLGWLMDLTLTDYRVGSSAPVWDALTVYNRGDRVRWTDLAVYEALTTTIAGDKPVGPASAKWYKVLDSFVGAEERALFNGQKIILEFALNKFLGTTFVQPVFSPPSASSDIYIVNQQTDDNSFLVGLTSPETSFVPLDASLSEDYVGQTYVAPPETNFAVYYPVAFTTEQLNIVKAITEKYKLYGTTPQYISY